MRNVRTCLHFFVRYGVGARGCKNHFISVFRFYPRLSTGLCYFRSLDKALLLEHSVGPPCFQGFPHPLFRPCLKVRKPRVHKNAFPHQLWAVALVSAPMAHTGQEWSSTIYKLALYQSGFGDIHTSFRHSNKAVGGLVEIKVTEACTFKQAVDKWPKILTAQR